MNCGRRQALNFLTGRESVAILPKEVTRGRSTTPNFLAVKRFEDALGIMRQSQCITTPMYRSFVDSGMCVNDQVVVRFFAEVARLRGNRIASFLERRASIPFPYERAPGPLRHS